MKPQSAALKGRGASFNPPNRFEELHLESLEDDNSYDDQEESRKILTKFFVDDSKTLLARNDSPDLGFDYSINPYRGCEHGCIYCYARPSHEYLGFSSGIDFETKIMVKLDAPKLLAEAFNSKTWKPQIVALSGNTDCYQPVERKLELTRQCLRVFLDFRNPVSIITKNGLVQRDLDILKEMAEFNIASVTVSITTLDNHLARIMEPRTSSPVKRLETIEVLSKNGVRVGVLVAPIIPGLTDEEIPSILKAAASSGAHYAGYTMLRLPYAIKDLFQDWLRRSMPNRAPKILSRIRDIRGGKLNDSTFGKRMKGEGQIAETIRQLFQASQKKHFRESPRFRLSSENFRRVGNDQLGMFT
ncbi:MAG: PA0069 family radical SAM protein [Ignavibacteriales bacterium]|nr:PA0069 family radical SAM protein [Ignavibacteriales bacterium]